MASLCYSEEFKRWMEHVKPLDRCLLQNLLHDQSDLQDSFYRELSFGTGGLRAQMGMGPNRLNVYTVGKATQGLSAWLLATYPSFDHLKVAIAYDTRHCSRLFAERAARVFAANQIETLLFSFPCPTPLLSFAVRRLGCAAGIVITASHNPKEYNGYKVYDHRGCQITTKAALEIQKEIGTVDPFELRMESFEDCLTSGLTRFISSDIEDSFLDEVAGVSFTDDLSNISVAYTPLNGTGARFVPKALRRAGLQRLNCVDRQMEPDGDFRSCPKPNPELDESLELGIDLAQRCGADLLLATDPDADRVGVAVRHGDRFVHLDGDEVGVLLFDWIIRQNISRGCSLENKVACTTIVTAPMADDIAFKAGLQLRRTLTGFKFIGEQICLLEDQGRVSDYLFGFEESLGYLAGSFVRDKDAISSCLLICEMASDYKRNKFDLVEAYSALCDRYGHWSNGQVSITYSGSEGQSRMQAIMNRLRKHVPSSLSGLRTVASIDYADGAEMPVVNYGADLIQHLPASNVIELRLEDGSRVLVRPSGTEPKIKAYVFAKDDSDEAAFNKKEQLIDVVRCFLSSR